MLKLHVDEVYPKSSSYPMIVNFQNGYTTDSFKNVECNLCIDGKTGSKVLITEIEDLLYTGNEENEERVKTLILARNKNTGKVRIIEAGRMDLKPVLNVDLESSQLLESSNLELSRKFGSKKQKQKMEQREKLKINTEIVTEQMKTVTKNLTVDNLDLTNYIKADGDEFYVPPIDRTADTVENVYNINDILTEDQFELIINEMADKDWSSELLPWIKSLYKSRSDYSKKQEVLVLYANCLIKLFTMLIKDIAKKNFLVCEISPVLSSIILTNFFTKPNGRLCRPNTYKDKALCHAIVLLLLANNFKFDMEGLCQSIKITPTTATTKIKVTGANVVTVGSKKIVQLKLPLYTKSGFRRKSSKF